MPIKNPPFEITESILTDAAEISEMVRRLSTLKLSSNPILRRTNRILVDMWQDGTLERIRHGKYWAYRLAQNNINCK